MLKRLLRLLGQQEKTSSTAIRRLHMVLVMDRVGLSPVYMDNMRADIVEAISKYLDVDPESMELDVHREGDAIVLVSNIPVKQLPRSIETPDPVAV